MPISFNKTILAGVAALVLSVTAKVSFAQTAVSTSNTQGLCCDTVQGKCVMPMPNRPSPSRVSEPGRYGDLQKRLDKLDTGNCANAYILNKAQAWLNMSRDVMHEGDGSNVVNATYDESEKLIKALEEGKIPSLETELVAGADKLRTDLWQIAANRKATPALLSSAAREVAFCEVYLVRAGHAQAKLGGKARTEPLIGMAQDICQAAKDKAPCPVVVPAPVVVVPTVTPAVVVAPQPTAAVIEAPPLLAPKRAAKQDRN
jgi:hypothetical protein